MNWGLEEVRVSRGRRLALADVTLPADRARITVVIGGDGAGKTTCLQVLAGLYADLTVEENVAFIASAYRIPASRAGEILERIAPGR